MCGHLNNSWHTCIVSTSRTLFVNIIIAVITAVASCSANQLGVQKILLCRNNVITTAVHRGSVYRESTISQCEQCRFVGDWFNEGQALVTCLAFLAMKVLADANWREYMSIGFHEF